MSAAPNLRTARLELRPLVEAGQIETLLQVTEAARAENEPAGTSEERRAHATRTVERSAMTFEHHGFGLWLMYLPEQRDPCGWCGIRNGEHPDAPELTYGLAPLARGAGLATEAVRAVIAHALALPATDHVWGAARPENLASIRVMERAGLVPAGRRVLGGIEYETFRWSPERV
jgi:RimJ/RimL family protein N-acetyltransferase